MQNPNQPTPPPNYHPQLQAQGGPHFAGHFRLPDPQSQALAQAAGLAQAQAFAQYQNPGLNANVGVSSPAVPTPTPTPTPTPGTGTGASAKRGSSQRPPSRPSGGSSGHGQGQGMASPLKTMELTPAVHRRKRKPPEKEIPEKVAAILPESALYTQLLEFESRIDAAMTRKKADFEECAKNPLRVQKVLRIYIFNTFTNQNKEKRNDEPPTWSLKIMGRILEHGIDPAADGSVLNSSISYPKFSSFFKKITIYLDQSLYPDNHVILWESARSPALHEGFEVKRKGDKEFTAIIRLEMNYVPEKFKLSPGLQEVLGIEVETRARILAALWNYVKMRKLQIPGDPTSFTCDPQLRKVFGEEKLKFAMLTQKITPHLSAPQPIHVEHKIKLSGNSPVGNTCYDVLVDVPLTSGKETSSFWSNFERSKEIDVCDQAISAAVKKIHEHRKRRAFFLGFSQSPAEFINSLLTSQARDLKLAAGDASRNVEKERRSEFYNQPWVEDAVIRYLNRKPSAGNEAAGNK